MLYFTSALLAVATLATAQSSSTPSPSQTTTRPAPTTPTYNGSQSLPGFGFIYPKKGDFYPLEPVPSSPNDVYPWKGEWHTVFQIPAERLNEEMGLRIWTSNSSIDSSNSTQTGWQNYFGLVFTPGLDGMTVPSPLHPATNKTWPADWYMANISATFFDASVWPDIVPGSGYFLELTSNKTTYAVSELFEFRVTDKKDPNVPKGGPYGPLNNAAEHTVPPLSLALVVSGVLGLWALV